MHDVSRLRWAAFDPTSHLSTLACFFRRLDVYFRYVRAGLEVEALLSLTDRQLASHDLTRAEVGPAVFVKHGLLFDRTP